LFWAPVALAALVALYDVFAVARRSVGIPYADDWGALAPDALPAGFTWRWLFTHHQGHQTLLSKLQVWALYRLDGWDLVTHHVFNQLLWTVAAALLSLLIRRSTRMPWPLVAAFAVFLFSQSTTFPVLGWISSCHFTILSSLAATRLLLDGEQRPRDLALGALAVWCAIFSNNHGLVYSCVLLSFFAAFKLARARLARERRAEIVGLALVCLAALAGAAAWRALTPDRFISLSLPPWDALFVDLLAGLVSRGFGWSDYPSRAFGLALIALTTAPAAWQLWKERARGSSGAWSLGAATFGWLGVLAVMILYRGGDQDISKVLVGIRGHYTLFACMLVPLCAANWYAVLPSGAARAGGLVALWLMCAVGGVRSAFWSPHPAQLRNRINRLQSDRLAELLHDGSSARTPDETMLSAALARARRLDMAFVRRLEAPRDEAAQAESKALRASAALMGSLLVVESAPGAAPRSVGRPYFFCGDAVMLRFDRDGASPELSIVRQGAHARLPDGTDYSFTIAAHQERLVYLPVVAPESALRRARETAPPLERLPLAAPAGTEALRSTPLYRDQDVEIGVLHARRPADWDSGRERVLLAYQGEAEARIGDRAYVSRPGTVLHLPEGVRGPVRLIPRPGRVFSGVWVGSLQSR
jgi:hypothetical protein